jgi:valyl-tRNA synthetase
VPLAGLIDVAQERARLERDLAKLTGELEGLERRLANADFAGRAAPEIVAATRARAAELRDQIAKLRGMLENL